MRALYYHRVVDRRAAGDAYGATAITAAELDAHAAELARNWRVLSLAEVDDHLASSRPLPARAVHLSFDDGYRDNLRAAEIFESHGLPWTLFVVADAVLDGFVPWYVRLAGALSDAPPEALAAHGGAARFKEAAKRAVMAAPADRHLAVLADLLHAAGLPHHTEALWPFLSVDEVDDLRRRGVEIGNHSATHPNLTRCSSAELDQEVAGSQARLEAALGRPVRFFAYPDGRFDRSVVTAVGRTHDIGAATWTASHPLAPLRLRRFPVGPGVGDLLDVLSPRYPARYRARRAKWELRRQVRRVATRPRSHGQHVAG